MTKTTHNKNVASTLSQASLTFVIINFILLFLKSGGKPNCSSVWDTAFAVFFVAIVFGVFTTFDVMLNNVRPGQPELNYSLVAFAAVGCWFFWLVHKASKLVYNLPAKAFCKLVISTPKKLRPIFHIPSNLISGFYLIKYNSFSTSKLIQILIQNGTFYGNSERFLQTYNTAKQYVSV